MARTTSLGTFPKGTPFADRSSAVIIASRGTVFDITVPLMTTLGGKAIDILLERMAS